MTGFDRPRPGLDEQWIEDEEVVSIDDRDFEILSPRQLLQRLGKVCATESPPRMTMRVGSTTLPLPVVHGHRRCRHQEADFVPLLVQYPVLLNRGVQDQHDDDDAGPDDGYQ